ncbi:hypothetical protein [Actinomadura atramentaria]|nr:hypothetical protein [Actinomadura atramentaria]
MSTPLANPRRTRLATWPTQSGEQDTEQQARSAETVPATSEDEQQAS